MISNFSIKSKVTCVCALIGAACYFIIPFGINLSKTSGSLDGRAYYDPNDADGDGMSDEWEKEFFGSISARDGSEDDDLDDISNLDEWLGRTNPLFLNPHSIGESGYVDIHANERGQYFTVRLDGVYSDPVVVVGPASSNALAPLTIRVKDVTASSFDVAIEDYVDVNTVIDGYHPTERVSWIVVEAGTHTLQSGQTLQAGHGQVSHVFQEIAFNEDFTTIPTVMSQVTSVNGSLALTTRHNNIDLDSFSALIQTQQNIDNSTLNSETLAWIAIENGVSDAVSGQIQIGRTRENTTHVWRNVNFAVEQPGDPAFFCMMQTTNGIDTSNIRYRNLGSLSAQVLVDEEHFGDNEVRHVAAESIGFLVATPGMFHVLATTGDQDADGIADSYELANGLIIGEIDYYKDLDGDGLTNAEEAREGTRADLSDSDGDGVSDYDEVNFLNSDALANDVGTFDLVETIPGSNFFNEFGGWASDESNALQRSTRGSIDYEINVQVSGLYSVEIDVSPNTLASLSKYHDFIISLDGEELSQESVVMESGQTATMRILTPWINPGAHQLKVFVDNSYTFRQIKIEEVRLYSSSGIDSNENQIPDWVELRILNSNKLTKDYSQSKTSPVCLEGEAGYFGLIESDLAMAELPNNGWYASLELSEDELTEATITYESGALSETISVEWVSTNLLAENFMYVRQGDALKLTAYEDEFSDKAYTISIGGSNYTVNSSSSVIHRFNETGPNLIEVYYTNADGLSLTHQVTVEVVSPVILPQVAIVPGYEVDWVVEGIHDNVVIQVDDAIGVYDGERLETGYKYSLGAASAISKTAIARLGYGGPILGKTEIQSMTLRSADETSVFSSRNSDGLFEISMPLVVNNISEDVEIKCEIIKAGVLFEDGSTEAVITSDDLNEFGSYNFKFLMNTLTSNCHRFSVWRDGVRIAYLF